MTILIPAFILAAVQSIPLNGMEGPQDSDLKAREAAASAALADELKLAKSDGIITSLEEIRAWVRPARHEDNAAPHYRRLSSGARIAGEAEFNQKLWAGDPEAVERAKILLNDHAADLAHIDSAVARPSCWFDRDWSLGYGVLKPELAKMKAAVKLLLIRSAIARTGGRPEDALQDQRKALIIAGHVEQEKGIIETLVGIACRQLVRDQVIHWTAAYPDDLRWLKRLREMGNEWPVISQKDALKPMLYEVLQTFDLCLTEDGRAVIGYKEDEDRALLRQLMQKVQTKSEAQLKIVKAFRRVWKDLEGGRLMTSRDLEANDRLFWEGMIYEPNAATLYEGMDSEGSFFYEQLSPARASLGSKALIEASIKIFERPDLDPAQAAMRIKSPADGLPVRVFRQGERLSLHLVDDPEDQSWGRLRLPARVKP